MNMDLNLKETAGRAGKDRARTTYLVLLLGEQVVQAKRRRSRAREEVSTRWGVVSGGVVAIDPGTGRYQQLPVS